MLQRAIACGDLNSRVYVVRYSCSKLHTKTISFALEMILGILLFLWLDSIKYVPSGCYDTARSKVICSLLGVARVTFLTQRWAYWCHQGVHKGDPDVYETWRYILDYNSLLLYIEEGFHFTRGNKKFHENEFLLKQWDVLQISYAVTRVISVL